MRIAEVIGTVTLNRWHPSLAGGQLSVGRAAVARQPGRPDRPNGAKNWSSTTSSAPASAAASP